MTITTTTPATFDAVTLATAKAHIRIDGTEEDTLVQQYLATATEYVETKTGLALASAGYTQTLAESEIEEVEGKAVRYSGGEAWRYVIELGRRPVTSVTSVKYYNLANVLTTIAATEWMLDTTAGVPAILLDDKPMCYARADAIQIVFTAGHASTAVPNLAKQAILMIAAEMYARREDAIVGTITSSAVLGSEKLLDMLTIGRVG